MMQPGGNTEKKQDNAPIRDRSANPFMACPICGGKSKVRTSEEVHPHLRRLYYCCLEVHCGMTWRAALMFECVISPSGISETMRPAINKDGKPPGADFGQMTIFDISARPKTATG